MKAIINTKENYSIIIESNQPFLIDVVTEHKIKVGDLSILLDKIDEIILSEI